MEKRIFLDEKVFTLRKFVLMKINKIERQNPKIAQLRCLLQDSGSLYPRLGQISQNTEIVFLNKSVI
jgi:hypothetical protein